MRARSFTRGAWSVLLALAISAPAVADETAAPQAEVTKPPRPRRWYGWEIATADVAAGVGAWFSRPATLALLGTGPSIHLLNGEVERAQASLAARLVGAGAGMAIAALVRANETCRAGRGDATVNPNAAATCPVDAGKILLGGACGLAVASALDVVVFGWTSTAEGAKALPGLGGDDEDARAPARLFPGLAVSAHGVSVSLSGSF